ncbi:MAG: SusD/RagB family nutrient-binding outer membrane lipoprotein [Mucilaginibacter polytrichastri]|nr:SusD/RagB family nutrient-binding outer membrane lipoprotein [Mucilaginibacter polytrichastri]
MKKQSFILYSLATLLTLSAGSCKKDFQEINTNPNTSQFALPQALLAPALTATVSANMSRAQRVTNELMQVTVNMGDTEGKIFRYDIRPAEADYLWNNWYLQLSNFKDIYTAASDPATQSNTYMAISLICQSWVYSLITDTYGDAPYFESNQAKEGNFMPVFDSQQAIYTDIFAKLEEANELLKTGTNVSAVSDPVYAGNAANWRKFGNALYLRLLLRVSGKAEIAATAIAKIREIAETDAANYPLMSSNTESALLRWTGAAPYVSPFATWRPGDWYGPRLSTFFVNNLNAWSDPRITKWATVFDGEYAGVPSGYPVGASPEGKSSLPTSLQTEGLLGNILNYGEVQLMLAEAAVRGFISGDAKMYYENGISAGITYWGLTVPANYLTGERVRWDETYPADRKMELIHLQKYYALFFTDVQQWIEQRRTGHPVLPNNGGLQNGGKMPARLNYPVYVQSVNRENYQAAIAAQGADVISTPVWWQKP